MKFFKISFNEIFKDEEKVVEKINKVIKEFSDIHKRPLFKSYPKVGKDIVNEIKKILTEQKHFRLSRVSQVSRMPINVVFFTRSDTRKRCNTWHLRIFEKKIIQKHMLS